MSAVKKLSPSDFVFHTHFVFLSVLLAVFTPETHGNEISLWLILFVQTRKQFYWGREEIYGKPHKTRVTCAEEIVYCPQLSKQNSEVRLEMFLALAGHRRWEEEKKDKPGKNACRFWWSMNNRSWSKGHVQYKKLFLPCQKPMNFKHWGVFAGYHKDAKVPCINASWSKENYLPRQNIGNLFSRLN